MPSNEKQRRAVRDLVAALKESEITPEGYFILWKTSALNFVIAAKGVLNTDPFTEDEERMLQATRESATLGRKLHKVDTQIAALRKQLNPLLEESNRLELAWIKAV